MLFFRISLAALFLGVCVAALDTPTTHYPTVIGHQARRGLAARHTVQELARARESLSPEAQSFFGTFHRIALISHSILEQWIADSLVLLFFQTRLSLGLLECESR